MKLSNIEASEIAQVYETWLNSYISGDIETYDSFFDDGYHFIGSTNNEEYLSRKETTDFLRKTADQLAGKTQLRNDEKTFERQGNLVIITHFFDAYFLSGTEWTYYDRFRFSSALHHTEQGWLFVYQHFSTPDSNANEGETIGYDQISAENKELREAIIRRTAELENKTRDLEIQNSLERIRAIAMGMSRTDDLLHIAESIFTELKKHGFDSLRNTMINIYQDQLESFLNYDFSPNSGKTLTNIEYKSHPFTENLIQETRSSKDVFSEFQVKGKELEEWRNYRKGMGEADDPALDTRTTLSYYFYSFENGSIGISTYEPINQNQLGVLKLFKNTFELTYKRYLDLQNALALARESQIEAALERLRARSLSMQKSDELADASILLEEEIRKLGIENWGCAFHIYDEETADGTPWDLEWFTSFAGFLPFYKTPRENIFLKYYEESKKGNPLFIQEFGPEVIKEHYDYLKSLPVLGEALTELHDSGVPLPERQIDHVAFFNHGHLLFITYKPVPESHDIFIRFAKVFNQAYTRFLDLEKAENQAKEAKIESALERIRGQVASMRESSELLEIMVSMRKEFVNLGHEAHYFWHMRWLPESYEKAMTSGDGTQIGMVMSLPRQIHGDIQAVADWEKGSDPLFVLAMETEDAVDYVHKMITWGDFEKVDPQAPTLEDIRHIGGLTFVMARTSHGEIGYSLPGSVPNPPQEDMDTLVRFARVFDLAYQRFEDLKKAEHQTRETQIELALERVRSRSMAMQKSEELQEVIQVVFEQFVSLDILVEHTGFILDYKDREDMFIWLADKNGVPSQITLPYFDCPHWNSFLETKKNGGNFFTNLHSFEEKNKFYNDLFELIPGAEEGLRKIYLSYPGLAISTVLLDNIGLYIENFESKPFTQEENAILMRFGKVFQQTYTRFLDLKRAEAQAKEAQIESSLERVRAQTMAMHNSQDIGKCIVMMFEELTALGVNEKTRFGIGILNHENENNQLWTASKIGAEFKLHIGHLEMSWHPLLKSARKAWKEQIPLHTYVLEGEDLLNYYKMLNQAPDYKIQIPLEKLPKREFHYGFVFEHGFFYAFSPIEFPADIIQIIHRFSSLFSQTYRRYLDLKRAEAQAREAQINLGVERVRAKALAMHNSSQILEVVDVLKNEMLGLEISGVVAATIYLKEEEDLIRMWDLTSVQDTTDGFQVTLDLKFKLSETHPKFFVRRIWNNTAQYFIEKQDPKDMAITIDWLRQYNAEEADNVAEFLATNTFEYLLHPTVKLANGKMSVDILNTSPPTEMESIMVKMGAAFDLAYKRFQDLQKAEAQVREAKIEAALEKIRSRTMAMQQSDELPEAANVLFNEVRKLGIPAWSCGYNILSEDLKSTTCWMSSENEIQTPFRLPLTEHESMLPWHQAILDQQEFFVYEQGGEDLVEHYRYLGELPELKPVFEQFDAAGISLPTFQVNHLGRFTHGFLLFITYERVPEAHDIFMRFTKVFEQTYTRFLDLQQKEEQGKKLIEEKLRLERTLKDLQATQAQLIQSEKMASLGELTAGIAHEIQNPLNFVNNFSEVSSEMLEELIEEIENGDLEEVRAISEDIKENLHKINHHGKRADSIVKSMLDHSRSSSGEKSLTDLNALADEFLRLSYHGIRAKDKSFNSEFKLELDPELPKVNIIAKDVGRVILNLVNNAFYAVNEKAKASNGTYQPEVVLTSKKIFYGIELSVKDNGNGIPESAKEKIFQPFFTTKPTGSGTGLGLSLSYDIVKAHGGDFRVQSAVGEGTEMTLFLPIDPDNQ